MSANDDNLKAIFEQYQKNNPVFEKRDEEEIFKNYFTTYLKTGVTKIKTVIRVLPGVNGAKTPFDEMWIHVYGIGKKFYTIPCLRREKGEPCACCETFDLLKGQGHPKEIYGKHRSKLAYVLKLIVRNEKINESKDEIIKEDEGIKFWRFNHHYKKDGVFDKLIAINESLGKDFSDPDTGCDLDITINKGASEAGVISSILPKESSILTTDLNKREQWLSDTRTHKDVYSYKPYSYGKIFAMGGFPVWDNTVKDYVEKKDNTQEIAKTQIDMNDLENIKTETDMRNLQNVEIPINMSSVSNVNSNETIDDDLPF